MNYEKFATIKDVTQLFKKLNDRSYHNRHILGDDRSAVIEIDVLSTLHPSKQLVKKESGFSVGGIESWFEKKKKRGQLYDKLSNEIQKLVKESNYEELVVVDEVGKIVLTPCHDILRVQTIIDMYAHPNNTFDDFLKHRQVTFEKYYTPFSRMRYSLDMPNHSNTWVCDPNRVTDFDMPLVNESSLELSEHQLQHIYEYFLRLEKYYEELDDCISRYEEVIRTMLYETATHFNIHKNKKTFRKVLEKYTSFHSYTNTRYL